jgi:hypothetical protein
MGFVAPLFILAAALIALPLWLHRLQTKSSDRQAFSSAMFLETTEQQVHVQKRLKYLLLLALRIALLVLLALAFAKPFWPLPPAATSSVDAGTQIILVDTSASMGRAGLFDQALGEARRAIDDAPTGAVIGIFAADENMRVVSELTTDGAKLRGTLSTLSVRPMRLDFGRAMAEIDHIAESLPAPVQLHVISDFQATAMPVRFADLIPSRISRLVHHPVGTSRPVNWSIDFLHQTADGLEVGVRGYGDTRRPADIEMTIGDGDAHVQRVTSAGQQVLSFSDLHYEPGDNRIDVSIETDDDWRADNRWFGIVENEPPAPVPLITVGGNGLAYTYLSAALESVAGGRYQVEPLLIGEFDPRILSRYRWALIEDIGALDPLHVDGISDYVQQGGNLLIFAGERSRNGESLPLSGHQLVPAITDADTDSFLSIGQIDIEHPALSATEGWHEVNVMRSLPIEPMDDDRILIRLDSNDPFVLERRVGKGRYLLVLSAADNHWSDFVIRPVFVSFMIESARYLSGASDISRNYLTGDRLPLSLIGSASGQIVDPDGKMILSLADTTREQQVKLDKPGIYEVYTAHGEQLIAANIDPRESDLEPVSQQMLDQWQDATRRDEDVVSNRATMTDSRQIELWPWILLFMALSLIAEMTLGNAHFAAGAKAH